MTRFKVKKRRRAKRRIRSATGKVLGTIVVMESLERVKK